MKIIAITDTHFGHKMLVNAGHRPCGYEDTLLRSMRTSNGDLFLHLGDICFGEDVMWHEKIMEATKQYKKRVLVRGNHDNKSYSWYITHGWDMVVEFMQLRIECKEVIFSHMPLLQEDVKPTLYYKPIVNFHGHMHGRGKLSHRMVDGVSRFNYDIAPDTHDMGVVSINRILASLDTHTPLRYNKDMEEDVKYSVYATDKEGDGHVMLIGEYEDPADIEIRVGMFSKDVVITIERSV